MSSHQYVVTAHKPTAVNACVTGRFYALFTFAGLTLFLFLHRQFHFLQRPQLDFGQKQSARVLRGNSGGTEATKGNMHLWKSLRYEILPTEGWFIFCCEAFLF
jgi:hypothetical protein